MTRFKLIVTKRAQQDFADIVVYTFDRWGMQQVKSYRQALQTALNQIHENPLHGCERHGLWMYPVAKHCIYYRVIKSSVRVIRILHKRMDAPRHLGS